MKPRLTISLLALLLSSTLLFNKAYAQAGAVPTMPPYFNLREWTPPPGEIASPTNGMNLNFIGAGMFSQTQDTFTPLTQTLEDVSNSPFACTLTERDASKTGVVENVITVLQNRLIAVILPSTWVQATYSSAIGDYVWSNPWSLQQDNLTGVEETGECLFFLKPATMELCQKFTPWYEFETSSLGETTLTFTLNDTMSPPKTLVFHINVIADDATTPAPADNSGQ